AGYLTDLLQKINGIQTAPTTPGAKNSFWLYPMRVTGIDPHVLAAEMKKGRINVTVGYTGKPIYLCTESLTAKKTYGSSQYPFSAFPTKYEYKEGLCPRAEKALSELICIPLDESWNRQQVEKVAGVIAAAIQNAADKKEGKAAGAHPTLVNTAPSN